MKKQQYVLEVAPGRFAQPKYPNRTTGDLYDAEKFWSMNEVVSFARSYYYPESAKVRTLVTEFTVTDEWTVNEASRKVKETLDTILDEKA